MAESYLKGSTLRVRRHSHAVLQDLFNKGYGPEGKSTNAHLQLRSNERTRTPVYFRPLALDNVITRCGSLVLLNSPSAVDLCKSSKVSQAVNTPRLSEVYLPAITGKMSNLQAARANLSHSCPYLYASRRRGSASSVISQRTSDFTAKQSYLKEQKDLRKSNVVVTMTYLGQGKSGPTQDEMKVLQQICGGENVCVFKGSVQPGEQFQFTSQRHLGYPFSASLYVNGIMAGRISSCCEYRYTPGFQQGRKSCFRLTRLSGGKPCYKCVNSRHGIASDGKEIHRDNLQTMKLLEDMVDSRPSSPLFIPLGMDRSVRRTRKLPKDGSAVSTDSEDLNGTVKESKTHKRRKKRQKNTGDSKGSEKSQAEGDTREDDTKLAASDHPKPPVKNSKDPKEKSNKNPGPDKKTEMPDSLQDGKVLSKQIGRKKPDPQESNGKNRSRERLRDFYKECVEMSTGLESGLDQQKWFKASKYERNKIKEQLTLGSHPISSASEVEPSEESDSSFLQSKTGKFKMHAKQGDSPRQDAPENDTSETGQDLQKQLDAMTEVLSTSDEVEQLVLRNTGLTDELLKGLAAALKKSLSQVTMINLNLNHIGPTGVRVLLDLLEAKPEIQGLHLFGNQLGNPGVQSLLAGVADLQDKTASMPGRRIYVGQFYFTCPSFKLLELDLGGNGISSEGLRVLGTYLTYHSQLKYLGLAKTLCSDIEGWMVLFESLKVNTSLTHIMLDENNLGDQGVKLFADSLRVNDSLRKVDLDSNSFGEFGGNAVLEALLSKSQCSLEHLSLEENYISTALMSKIHQVVKPNSLSPL